MNIKNLTDGQLLDLRYEIINELDTRGIKR